jgi:hypothetical protein
VTLARAGALAVIAALRIANCGLRNDCGLPGSDPQAAILSPQSTVRNPPSAIRNESALRIPRSAIADFDRARVLAAADAFLTLPPLTITASTSPRSAGGQDDFFSEGDYWWPDPAHPDGPYIRRDGESNPDNFVEHRRALIRLSVEAPALTAAWTLTGDARYATRARKHLRAWFVDVATLLFGGLALGKPGYVDFWKTLKADSRVEEVVRNVFIRQPILWLE